METSLIATVLNEENTIENFIKSAFLQTKIPDEIIIVDGGSNDNTVEKIKSLISKGQYQKILKKTKFKLIVKHGNRSVGRNEAIKHATGDIILVSDAGCTLKRDWIEKIIEPFNDTAVDVVAGYYSSKAKTIFQKCLVPYVLVMPDKVNSETFLPATRSMAFKKTVWKKLEGFDEGLSHNEDYAFANRLEKIKARIFFTKDAIVYWSPRKNLFQAFKMFFRFSLGDSESKIYRSTVLLLFGRYIFALYFVFLIVLYKSFIGLIVIILFFFIYLIWSIFKNYKYVKNKQAVVILPLLQITADLAVLFGTTFGILKLIKEYDYFNYVKNNKILFLILFVYSVILLFTLKWGIPNKNHPFPYHMDEWHQFNAVRSTFKYGTPNMAGAANGTMFHFILSGFFLIPFTLLKIIDPVILKIDDYIMRERIFEILRINTIIWGILSILVLNKIAGIINISKKLSVFLFVFTPIWLTLSGNFKYDIALMFWILLSILFLLRFAINPTSKNYILMAIPSSLAIAVKVSAIPLFFIYISSFFLFKEYLKKIRLLFLGALLFILIIVFFGAPDTLFGKGNIYDYVYTNVISGPKEVFNFELDMNQWLYLVTRHYPLVFGSGLIMFFAVSSIIWIVFTVKEGIRKNYEKNRTVFLLFISLAFFYISLLPLKILAVGNRSLVLLPFFVLIIGLAWKKIEDKLRFKPLTVLPIAFFILLQLYYSFAWMYMKINSSQEVSSIWIEFNIPKNQIIGVENIPIYQLLPNILQKEFYFKQYNVNYNFNFKYEVINNKTKKLPSVVVITNDEIESKIFPDSSKKKLIDRLLKEKYKKVVTFVPDQTFYKLLGTDKDYYLSGLLIASPLTISIYEN